VEGAKSIFPRKTLPDPNFSCPNLGERHCAKFSSGN